MLNIMNFGMYKGHLVTHVLYMNPRYFAWCKKNVKGFKFSVRDYEMFLLWLSVCRNNESYTGYRYERKNMKFIERCNEDGKYNEFPDDVFLTKESAVEYLNSTKNHLYNKH